MKKLFSIIATFAFLIGLTAGAQAASYKLESLTISSNTVGAVTNNVPAATTNSSLAAVIDCEKFSNVGISIRSKQDGAGVLTNNYLFVGTVDGTNYSSDVKRTVWIAATGTLTASVVTNLNVTGFKKIKLITIQNPNATILTNLQFNVGYKEADNGTQ